MARNSKSYMNNVFDALDGDQKDGGKPPQNEEEPHHDPADETTGQDETEVEDADEDLIVAKNPRKQKKKKEETHQRKTFLIEKEMLEWMKKEARRYGHGFYIDFINFSLKLGREKYEEAKKKKK